MTAKAYSTAKSTKQVSAKTVFPVALFFSLTLFLADIAFAAGLPSTAAAEQTLAKLVVARENRCSRYDRKKDYRYSSSIEKRIIQNQGGHFSPYSGRSFSSLKETDIEHIVATSEAHDSGLCAYDRTTRKRFASNLDNLTTAAPKLNRHRKSGKDVGEWQPQLLTLSFNGQKETNHCWMAKVVINVKDKYSLTIDQREKQAIIDMLETCLNS